jgi:hypothetical protein
MPYPAIMDTQPSRRKGTAVWVSDEDGDLLRAISSAEDRPQQRVISRALRTYADISPEYRATLAESVFEAKKA